MSFVRTSPRPRHIFVLPLLILSGCATSPRLGKDEGRAAIVWDHPDVAPPATPAASPDAERQLLAELEEAERTEGDPLTLADSLYRLAILRRQQGESAEAEQLYRRALEIRERQQGPDHPDVAIVLNNLGVLQATEGDSDAAQALLERALSIRVAALGEDNVSTAQSLSNLALLHAARGDATAAEPLYRRSLAVLEKAEAEGDSHPADLGRVLENYAALLHETGREAEAAELEARARALDGRAPE